MNKKVLTLCAGFLLAGGLCTVANASNWTTDDCYVQDSKKFHIIEQTAEITGIGGIETTTGYFNGYYLTFDANGDLVFAPNTTPKDKNAYWTITTRTNGGNVEYQLTNAEGKTLSWTYTDAAGNDVEVSWFLVGHTIATVGGVTKDANVLKFYDKAGDLQFLTINNPDVNGNYPFELSTTESACFDNVEIAEKEIEARDLNAELNGGFNLSFGPGKDKAYPNLTRAEAFTGKLTAVGVNGNDTDTEYYFIQKGATSAQDKFVVLSDDYLGGTTSTLDGTEDAIYRGYNFKLVSRHEFETKHNPNNAIFKVEYSYDFNDTDSLIISMPNAGIATFNGETYDQLGSLPTTGLPTAGYSSSAHQGLRLFVANVLDENVLTVIEYSKAKDRLAVQDYNNYTTAEFGAIAPYVQFGEGNLVDVTVFAGKIWNITNMNGESLTPAVDTKAADIDTYAELFDAKGQVDLTSPEGHWLLTKENDKYAFINRESGETWDISDSKWVIRKTDVADVYEIYNTKYNSDPIYNYNNWYKVTIKEANEKVGKVSETGYAKYDLAEEELNGKYLSFETSLGVTAYIGKDKDDNVILTTDKDNAIEFRVKGLTHDFTDHDGDIASDTLIHVTNYVGADLKMAKDTLRFFHYSFYEHFSEKYLMYNSDEKKFELSDWTPAGNAHDDFNLGESPYTFVVKEKADGTNVLVRGYAIGYDWCSTATGKHVIQKDYIASNLDLEGKDVYYDFDNEFYTNLGSASKVYAATQPGTITEMVGIYNYRDNDRISIENIETPEYMKVTGAIDTAKISLQRQPNFFLYEHNANGTNFLSMEHVADVEDMKAAILVDTAYVRNNTYKPQYLLAVGAKHVEPVYDNAGHMLEPDTTYGRFLVNMVDSAIVYGLDKKSNPYIWEQLNGNDYYRLAFIDGIHTGDKLILNTAKAKTSINLSNNNDKVCTFAFRYVDEDREGVKIETLYGVEANGTPIRGWLKYQNNVPVVTRDYDDAHVFLVDNTTTEAPTANEEISANAVVSVVATDGAVIVKGAEGKNVIVSTILGKVDRCSGRYRSGIC